MECDRARGNYGQCIPFAGKAPKIADSAFIAPGAVLIGDVEIGEEASIWPNAVLRGDIASIRIGDGSNIQDNCVVHVDYDTPTIVGNRVTVGHGAILHGCTVGDGSLIGMKAVCLNGSVIGKQAIVAAGALVSEGKVVPDRTLAMGIPAKPVRAVTGDDLDRVDNGNESYRRLASAYMKEFAQNRSR